MRTFVRSITGFAATAAFISVGFFNQQLVYNKAMFTEQPAKFDARLTAMHTNQLTGEFFAPAKKVNFDQLSRFYGMVRN